MTMARLVSICHIGLLLQSVLATQELDETSWLQLINSGKNGMIKFYQPWCGHCTRMKPEWDRLAENAHPSVFIADVNCSDEEELCEKNEISGYPTVKVYKNGIDEKYHGGRGYDELLEYVETHLARKCDVKQPSGCSEKAQSYIGKWKTKTLADVTKEISRLEGMTDSTMTSDLKSWLRERVSILQQLESATVAEES